MPSSDLKGVNPWVDVQDHIREGTSYRYYKLLIGGDAPDKPVCLLFDGDLLTAYTALTLNPETGRFRLSTGIIGEVHSSAFSEDIDVEEFNRLCARQIEHARMQRQSCRTPH